MKRLLTMALVLAMMATMLVVTPVTYAEEDDMMQIEAISNESGIDEFTASFTLPQDVTWVVWTVYATNGTIEDTSDDEIIFIDEKRGSEAAANGFSFTFNSNVEEDLLDKLPFAAEANISFIDSSKNKLERRKEYVYLPYEDVQKYIRELFNLDVEEESGVEESVTVAAGKLGITLPSCYVDKFEFDDKVVNCLLNPEIFPGRDYATKIADSYPTTNIAPVEFLNDLKTATCLISYNSKNATSISNLIQDDYDKVGVTEEGSEKFKASENKTSIASKLARVTYGTVDDFVKQFNAYVFLDELSTKSLYDVMDYIDRAFNNNDFYFYSQQEHYDDPQPFNYYPEFKSYLNNDDNIAYAEGRLSEAELPELDDLRILFEEIIDVFEGSDPEEEEEEEEYTPPTGGGGVVSVTPAKPIVGDDAPKFADIDDVAWAHEAINALAKEKVLAGVTSTQFQPNASVTREQFVQIIVKTFGLTSSGSMVPFADVDQGAWYAGSLNTAYELGIISGTSEKTFGVGATITRQDMATIMYRVANYLGINLVAKSERTLTDAAYISGYATSAVNALYKAGIINGVSDGVFAGSQIATRAQAAKLCYDLREAK